MKTMSSEVPGLVQSDLERKTRGYWVVSTAYRRPTNESHVYNVGIGEIVTCVAITMLTDCSVVNPQRSLYNSAQLLLQDIIYGDPDEHAQA